MNITYLSTNNKCFDNNNGSIIIESINFTPDEILIYGDGYEVIWTGNFEQDSLSSDGLVASNLSNGIYTFKIVSLNFNDEGPEYSVEISSPERLLFTKVKYSDGSCGDNAQLYAEISGGTPPYSVSIANSNITTSNNAVNFTDLPPGQLILSITDSNDCSYEYPEQILIKNSAFSNIINNVFSPTLLDSFAVFDISITGDGPFSFNFYNKDTEEYTNIDMYHTKYLKSFNNNEKIYNYFFDDILTPGEYYLTIKNSTGCQNIIESLNIPNIRPMAVNMNLSANTNDFVPQYFSPLRILDTLLIPYKLIKDNSIIWQNLKDKNIKDNIQIFVNDEPYNFQIVRNTLNKSCIGDGQIEILKLGEKEDEWFYYFYIAPSFNIDVDPDILSSKLEIKILENIYNIIIGLDSDGNIENNNLSLVISSFILDGLGYNNFYNGGPLNVSLTEPISTSDYDYTVKNIKKNVNVNMYSTGFVTILNFLEQFNILNENVSINTSACNISNLDYRYNINIKKLLKSINNFNNIEFYIYNPKFSIPNGYISFDISGNDFFSLSSGENQTNSYEIDFFFLKENETKLSKLYLGSEILRNTTDIENIDNGFYIIRIKDIYNNMPKIVTFNGVSVSYDQHFVQSKKKIQQYNSFLLDYYQYGDILAYIGNDTNIIDDDSIPSSNNNIVDLPEFSLSPTIRIIQQTKDLSNTGEINIELLNTGVTCYLYGPKNYVANFNTNTKFTNLVPGVYIILGDEEQLKRLSLHQNEIRLNLSKNTTEDIFLEFNSYENIIEIRDE